VADPAFGRAEFDSGGCMKKLLAGVAVASLATLTLAGTAGAVSPAAAQQVTITIDVAAAKGTPAPVTATGPISGTGTDVRKSRVLRRVDIAKDVLTFAGGTVTVRDVGLRRTKLDTTTCVRTLTERGLWRIAKGTGSYATAKGHGHFKATGTIQGAQTGTGCDFTTPTGTIVVTATGKVRI
jgi:hypothetical protein